MTQSFRKSRATTLVKQSYLQSRGVTLEKSKPLPLPSAPEHQYRVFAKGQRQAILIKSSEGIPKGTDFIWNILRKGSILKAHSKTMENLVVSN